MKVKPRTNRRVIDIMQTAVVQQHQMYEYDMRDRYMQLVVPALQEKKIEIANILKYNFKKKLNKNEIYLSDNIISNRYKNTKAIQQLLAIKYVNDLMRRIYYSTRAMSKTIKFLNTWARQQIQTQLYFYKKVQQIATTKDDIVYAYIKYNNIKNFYKDILIRNLKGICKRYYSILKKYKRMWTHNILLKTIIRSKKRNRIIPFIFNMRKRLFKYLRLGVLFNIKYWTNNIRKMTKKYNIFKESANENIFMKEIGNNSTRLIKGSNSTKQSAIHPLILLYAVLGGYKRYKSNTADKIKMHYYSVLMQHVVANNNKIYLKKRRRRVIKRKKYYARLIMQHLMHNKPRYLIRKAYLNNRVNSTISRMGLTKQINATNTAIKLNALTKFFLKRYISTLLIMHQNRSKFKIFSILNSKAFNTYNFISKRNKRKKSIWTEMRNRRRRKRMMRGIKRRRKKEISMCLGRAIRRAKYRARYVLNADTSGYWIIDNMIKSKFNKRRRHRMYYKMRKVRERRLKWVRKRSKIYNLIPANITLVRQINLYNNLKSKFAI